MEERVIEEALELLRPALSADGYSLRLGALMPQGIVEIILEAGTESCLDCLVSEQTMVSILENAIRERGISIDHVELVKVGFSRAR